jgi:predicted nucleotidyltransferase/uncharacterized protein (UPF0332 family)
MVRKKTSKQKISKKDHKKKIPATKKKSRIIEKKLPKTLHLKIESDIAMDFATKIYKKFDKIIKSVILFGSAAKQTAVTGSDIDIILIIDDVSIRWDRELIAWYREELDKTIKSSPYSRNLHITTVKLSTWWEDLMKGDPVVINVLRYGKAMLDFAGFFNPLKFLLIEGKIKSTPEAVHNCLQRAPQHLLRSKAAELNSIEGLYWAMVDSAQAALIAANVLPPSPEHISENLTNIFVNKGELKSKYVLWYKDLLTLHKKIAHGEITDLKGIVIDTWQERTNEFLKVMAELVNKIIG